jgi:hypothetical protein
VNAAGCSFFDAADDLVRERVRFVDDAAPFDLAGGTSRVEWDAEPVKPERL